MATSTYITEALRLVDKADAFTDGGDDRDAAAAGSALAAQAQVYATLALMESVDLLTETVYTAADRISEAIAATRNP